MKLLIAIPAYNEEDSIESIVERSLAARGEIIAKSPVTDVEIVAVSDGSTDRTVELLSRYARKIKVVVFKENRGYGAAIKAAWQQSDAELLGFLDADGTCDPRFFSELCSALLADDLDVVLGCRLNAESKMPLIRRIGNLLFAVILTVLAQTRVRDTASGMRVVHRRCLRKLFPLPDGMHFTPAMSARALLAGGVRIGEIDMPYHDRQGESKLRVGKDGLRFLRIILETAFLYRPSRPLGLLAVACFAMAGALMVTPIVYYCQNRSVAEWMIYRFVVSHLVGLSGCLLFSASYLTRKIVDLSFSQQGAPRAQRIVMTLVFSNSFFWVLPALLMLAGGALVAPSFLELVRTGATYLHWSRFVAMSFLVGTALILIITKIIDYVLTLVADQVAYLASYSPDEISAKRKALG
jgi:glycosyltransferase involved in cell wall biosynthesis